MCCNRWQGDTGSWYSVDDAFLSLIYCCLLYGGLTWYFDHIVPNSFGLALHPLFFLDPVYWGFEGFTKKEVVNQVEVVMSDEELGDDDVKTEERAVRSGEADDGTKAIVINNLQKTVRPLHFATLLYPFPYIIFSIQLIFHKIVLRFVFLFFKCSVRVARI